MSSGTSVTATATERDILELQAQMAAFMAAGSIQRPTGWLENNSMLGCMEAPHLEFEGSKLELESILGFGVTSVVYQCSCSSEAAGGGKVAVKVAKPGDSMQHEHAVLKSLQQGGVQGVPRALALLQGGTALLLQPVGRPLDPQTFMACERIFESMADLVATLRRSHELGYMHRDIRPNNLLLVGSRTVYIADWGFACSGTEPVLHEGTVKFASDNVLHLLGQAEQRLTYRPADDLQSLVKTIFSLKHVHEMQPLAAIPKDDIAAIQGLWTSCLDGRPTWASAMQAAARCDYAQVATLLTRLLE